MEFGREYGILNNINFDYLKKKIANTSDECLERILNTNNDL